MRIAVASLGSRGVVQPMAALAVALAARGHSVRLITTRGYDGLVDGTGVEHCAICVDIRAELASEEAQASAFWAQYRRRAARGAGDGSARGDAALAQAC